MANGRITIELPKQTKDRLARFALRYGFSLQDFSRRVFDELSSDIPEESLTDYRDARRLRTSLHRALRDWKAGRIVSLEEIVPSSRTRGSVTRASVR